MGRLRDRLLGFADGSYIDRSSCDAAFDWMHRRDAIGDRIHLLLAWLGMFLLMGPPTATELAFAPLAVFFFVRTINTLPVWIHGFGQPAVLAAVALFAWLAVTLAWSPDRHQGLAELNRMRWFLLVPLVYPAIAHRRALAHALAFGLMVASVVQLMSAIPALKPLFEFRHAGRITGWWDPVVAGSIQAGAVGLFLPAALTGVGRSRAIGLVGLALSSVGLLASGTRGAWIAGALLLMVAVPMVLRGAGPRAKRSAAVVVAVILVAGLGAGVVWRDGVSVRVSQAFEEIEAAGRGEFESPTGARIAVMRLSGETGIGQPWGAGAGSVRTLAAERFGDDRPMFHLAHAHSTPAHLFVTGGVPAVLLGCALGFVLLCNGFGGTTDDPRASIERGIPYAMLGLAFASVFDVVLINAQVAAFVGALAALSPAYVPDSAQEPKPDG